VGGTSGSVGLTGAGTSGSLFGFGIRSLGVEPLGGSGTFGSGALSSGALGSGAFGSGSFGSGHLAGDAAIGRAHTTAKHSAGEASTRAGSPSGEVGGKGQLPSRAGTSSTRAPSPSAGLGSSFGGGAPSARGASPLAANGTGSAARGLSPSRNNGGGVSGINAWLVFPTDSFPFPDYGRSRSPPPADRPTTVSVPQTRSSAGGGGDDMRVDGGGRGPRFFVEGNGRPFPDLAEMGSQVHSEPFILMDANFVAGTNFQFQNVPSVQPSQSPSRRQRASPEVHPLDSQGSDLHIVGYSQTLSGAPSSGEAQASAEAPPSGSPPARSGDGEASTSKKTAGTAYVARPSSSPSLVSLSAGADAIDRHMAILAPIDNNTDVALGGSERLPPATLTPSPPLQRWPKTGSLHEDSISTAASSAFASRQLADPQSLPLQRRPQGSPKAADALQRRATSGHLNAPNGVSMAGNVIGTGGAGSWLPGMRAPDQQQKGTLPQLAQGGPARNLATDGKSRSTPVLGAQKLGKNLVSPAGQRRPSTPGSIVVLGRKHERC